MKRTLPVLLPFMLFFSLIMACSPSSKNEQQYWDNHQKNAVEYKTLYPGLTAVIDGNLANATKVMDAAKALKDEEAKAKKMEEGNAVAAVIVGKITEVKLKIEGLEKTAGKLGDLKLPKSKAGKRRDAMTLASESASKVRTTLAEAKPADEAEAAKLLDDQVGILISEQGNADRAYKSLKPKKAKKAKKKKKN